MIVTFASQDSQGMLSLLSVIQQCLKAGKKQQWRTASLTNICAGLLAGLKVLPILVYKFFCLLTNCIEKIGQDSSMVKVRTWCLPRVEVY